MPISPSDLRAGDGFYVPSERSEFVACPELYYRAGCGIELFSQVRVPRGFDWINLPV